MSSTDDDLVRQYLSRLATAADILPRDRRAELIDEISTHITEARAAVDAGGTSDSIATVLARLGSPEEIVQAAAEQGAAGSTGFAGGATIPGTGQGAYAAAGYGPVDQGAAGGPPGWQAQLNYGQPARYGGQGLGAMEVLAIVLLLFGGFLVGIGWIVGVVLLWLSPRWRLSDKLLGTLIWPGGLAAAFVALAAASLTAASVTTCSNGVCATSGGTDPTWLGPTLAVAAMVLLIVGPILVTVRLARQARRWPDSMPGAVAPVQSR